MDYSTKNDTIWSSKRNEGLRWPKLAFNYYFTCLCGLPPRTSIDLTWCWRGRGRSLESWESIPMRFWTSQQDACHATHVMASRLQKQGDMTAQCCLSKLQNNAKSKNSAVFGSACPGPYLPRHLVWEFRECHSLGFRVSSFFLECQLRRVILWFR